MSRHSRNWYFLNHLEECLLVDPDFEITESFTTANEEELSYENRRQSEATHGYQTGEEPIRS